MGVAEHVRRDILGHSPRSMTGDYTHASPEEMERAMEAVAAYAGRNFSGLGKISANHEAAADTPIRRRLVSRCHLRERLVAGGRLELPTLGL